MQLFEKQTFFSIKLFPLASLLLKKMLNTETTITSAKMNANKMTSNFFKITFCFLLSIVKSLKHEILIYILTIYERIFSVIFIEKIYFQQLKFDLIKLQIYNIDIFLSTISKISK